MHTASIPGVTAARQQVDRQLAVSSSLEARVMGQRRHPEVPRDKGLEDPRGLGRPCRNRERRAVPGLGWWREGELVAPKWVQSRHRGNETRRERSVKSCKTAMRKGRKKTESAHRILPERAGLGFELGSAGHVPRAFPTYSNRPPQDHTDPWTGSLPAHRRLDAVAPDDG